MIYTDKQGNQQTKWSWWDYRGICFVKLLMLINQSIFAKAIKAKLHQCCDETHSKSRKHLEHLADIMTRHSWKSSIKIHLELEINTHLTIWNLQLALILPTWVVNLVGVAVRQTGFRGKKNKWMVRLDSLDIS